MALRRTTIILLFLSVLSPGMLAETGSPDVRSIQAVMTDFDTAMSARDVDAVMATLASSDDLTLFLPMPFVPMRIEGTSTARKAFEILFQNLPKQAAFQVTRHQTIVQVQGNVALTYSYQNYYLNAGALPHKLLCRTTMVLAKQADGRWRIVHLHSGALPEVGDYFPE
jgi:ketosteroid isomerase-like protein